MPASRFLSKSDYITGLVCRRKLWQRLWDRDSADPPSGISQLNMDMGVRFGKLAHRLFPDATLIDRARLDHAVTATREAIDAGAVAVLEAAFAHQRCRIVADVIERQPDGCWHLIEVKSSSSVKDEHVDDLAYQRWVMERAGFRVSRASVIHADPTGRWPDADTIFTITDVTERVDEAMDRVPGNLEPMLSLLDTGASKPHARRHFSKACHECEFKKRVCWRDIGKFTIYDVVNVSKLQILESVGVLYVDDIPDDVDLADGDRRHVDLIRKQGRYLNREALRERLASLVYPIHFLDFESVATPIPLFDDTGPWQQIAFQYSLHVRQRPGGPVDHREYLHRAPTNPAEALTRHLVQDVADTGSIVVYHAQMESGVIDALKHQFPHHADALESMLGRIWDLEILFLRHYRDWRFGNKSSIKVVLPVLIPELSYEDLDVQDGGSASLAWLDMRATENTDEADVIADRLREYCKLDTFAMVRLLDEVTSACDGGPVPET